MTRTIARWHGIAVALLAIFALPALAQDQELEPLTPEDQAQYEELAALLQALDPRTGDIGLATLHVPDGFYYLDTEDAETVLVDLWGNPPDQNVLGILFPAH